MKRMGPTNIYLRKLINELRKVASKNNAKIWRRVAELLEKPTRKRVRVNLGKINRYTEEGDVIVIPGKVLASGSLDHSVTVAAWDFSVNAYKKVSRVGKAITIKRLLEENPNGSGVKIIV